MNSESSSVVITGASSGIGRALAIERARRGDVGTIVVNAGANDSTNAGSGGLDEQFDLIQTHLAGAIATLDAAAEYFLARGKGRVVGISSLASRRPLPQQAAREIATLIRKRVRVGIVPALPWRLPRPSLGYLPERMAKI